MSLCVFARVGWLVHPIADGTLAASPSNPTSSAGWSMDMAAPTADVESRWRGGSSPKCVGGVWEFVPRRLGYVADIVTVSTATVMGRVWNLQTPEALPLCLFQHCIHLPWPLLPDAHILFTNLARSQWVAQWVEKIKGRELKQVPLECPSCPSPTLNNLWFHKTRTNSLHKCEMLLFTQSYSSLGETWQTSTRLQVSFIEFFS